MVIYVQLDAQVRNRASISGSTGAITCIAVKCAQATRSVPDGMSLAD